MTDYVIRPADPATDAAPASAITAKAFPYLLQDATSTAHRMGDTRNQPMRHVAEIDGDVVAYASTAVAAESARPGTVALSLLVAEEHRGKGIGSALLARLEDHWTAIGATNVVARATTPEAIRFGERHGFAASRTERISHVALADVPDPLPIPEPYTLRYYEDVEREDLYVIDGKVVGDIPSDGGWAMPSFEEWSEIYLTDPRLAPELTAIIYDGDDPVAVSWLERIGDRVWSALCGTDPAYRGRGLAKVAKTHSLRRALERGAVDAYTNNDGTNAPMLAVNTWLGYRLYIEQRTLVRELGC
ncbi:GNAT family N-acetyltransferase [Stackebrandtia soli]|uniref:GNAT family N-acetyltransferase n=1 Tax=Stackebrandtia soli TaxID=1892856 RepID=UPI0039E72C75